MDSFLLKTFTVLAQTKNFTHAAKKLHLSQSAVSLQIARLEALIGQALFIRDKRNVRLSAEGEQLLGYAQQILNLEEEMLTHFHQPSLVTGEVRFGTPEDLATVYLPSILANFIGCYPKVLLNVSCEFTMTLLKGFESHHYDLILIKQDPAHPHPNSEEVWKEPVSWVGRKSERPFKWDGRDILPLVLAPAPCVYRERAIEALNQAAIRWRIVYTSPSLTGTVAAVKAGLGLSVLPRDLTTKDIQSIRDLPSLKDTQIALLKQESASEATKALAKYIIKNLSHSS